MLDNIIGELNNYRKKALIFLLGTLVINILILGYLIFVNKNHLYIVIGSVSLVIIDNIFLLIVLISIYKKSVKEQQEELFPLLLKDVNFNWYLDITKFVKEETLCSLFIERYGTFSSSKKITGKLNNIDYEFGFISNVISTGQSASDVFIGTYIKLSLEDEHNGIIQIRDKGRPTKTKDLKLKKFENQLTLNNTELKFYTNNEDMANKLLTNDLISLYMDIKRNYKKGIYLTIVDDKFIIGIHNRKNILKFSLFKKLDFNLINERKKALRSIYKIIEKTSNYNLYK